MKEDTPHKTAEERARDVLLDGDTVPGKVRGALVLAALLGSLVVGVALGTMLVGLAKWRLGMLAAGCLMLFVSMRLLRVLKDAERTCTGCLCPPHAADCPSLHCRCPERSAVTTEVAQA